MKRKGLRFNARTVVVFTVLLLAANLALGVLLVSRSRASIRSLLNERMLGIAGTAGALLDGETLASFTKEDVGGEKHRDILEKLTLFAENLNFNYIYVVRAAGDGTYEFIVDPDKEAPAAFGEKIEYTPALGSAGSGTAAVDSVAVSDKWGKYYTAFCPVFTDNGEIGGIVGVDFDADWYEKQITANTVYIIIVGTLALIGGGGAVLILTARLRKRFKKLNEDASSIASDVGTLINEIRSEQGYDAIAPPDGDAGTAEGEFSGSGDESEDIEKLSRDVKQIKVNLKRYIDFIHSKAYTDVMTGIGNRAAYFDFVHSIDEVIENPGLRFSVVVFDINGLKTANDDFGHDIGDEIICEAAECIKSVFGASTVFRIGGDEFAAVLENTSEEEVEVLFRKLDESIDISNKKRAEKNCMPLSLSKGFSEFVPGEDISYKQVFKRADVAMYYDKNEYYKKYGYRR
ncbi:MAG: diguanylate cyclase [Clostridia bacterium]|nr:diguanylate cyclase [Clostridia bacterium]